MLALTKQNKTVEKKCSSSKKEIKIRGKGAPTSNRRTRCSSGASDRPGRWQWSSLRNKNIFFSSTPAPHTFLNSFGRAANPKSGRFASGAEGPTLMYHVCPTYVVIPAHLFRNSDPGSHGHMGTHPPLPSTAPPFIFIATRPQHFFPSSTRVELCVRTLRRRLQPFFAHEKSPPSGASNSRNLRPYL